MIGGSPPSPSPVLDVPWAVLEYRQWLLQTPVRGERASYLFDEPTCRFVPEPGDELTLRPDLQISGAGNGTRLRAGTGEEVTVSGVSAEASAWIVKTLEQPTTAGELLRSAPEREAVQRFVAQVFGKLLFASRSIGELELRVPAAEIVRFPGSPYEVERPYWSNMAAVAEEFPRLCDTLDDPVRFVSTLRELHVTLLMGRDLACFYRPASALRAERICPGRLHDEPSSSIATKAGPSLITRGLRVHAPWLGGAGYPDALSHSLEAAQSEAVSCSEARPSAPPPEGLLTDGWSLDDDCVRPWFLPPRPLLPAHLDALRCALRDARRSAEQQALGACLGGLAAFHRTFVRVHPFSCGNQALAMGIVNSVLREVGRPGLPHLWLDHLAFRVNVAAYARLFQRAARVFGMTASSRVERYRELAARRLALFGALRALSSAAGIAEWQALMGAHPEWAALLLLVD